MGIERYILQGLLVPEWKTKSSGKSSWSKIAKDTLAHYGPDDKKPRKTSQIQGKLSKSPRTTPSSRSPTDKYSRLGSFVGGRGGASTIKILHLVKVSLLGKKGF